MPFYIIRNDITKMACDAIVNAANSSLLGGGGVDGAIHRAAGPRLLEECRGIGGCPTGEARITAGYDLSARHVIHTVGPVWQGGGHGEREALTSCYTESLRLAVENGCETVAFPLISSGIYGYPKAEALTVAETAIRTFLETHEDMTVYLIVFDRDALRISRERFREIRALIDDAYVAEQEAKDTRRRGIFGMNSMSMGLMQMPQKKKDKKAPPPVHDAVMEEMPAAATAAPPDLSAALGQIDESFSQMVLREIDARGMKDSECYKRANMDRKLFSKIRSDIHYRPKKTTAIALAIALRLDLAGTRDLLQKAGFALSKSVPFDIIIEYCILHEIYDVMEVNEILFAFDQALL